MENVFLKYEGILLENYGAARHLRTIALSLYGIAKVDLGCIKNLDIKHAKIVFEMMQYFYRYGENLNSEKGPEISELLFKMMEKNNGKKS